MRYFRGIIFMGTEIYREIFKSALVYLKNKNSEAYLEPSSTSTLAFLRK